MSDDRIVIALDPGHGGDDTGVIAHGLVEKDWTLEVAGIVFNMLGSPFEPFITRPTDKDIGLTEAAKRAREVKAEVAFCLHVNAGPEEWGGLIALHLPGDDLGKVVAQEVHAYAPLRLLRTGGAQEATRKDWPRVVNVLQPYADRGIPACLVEFGFATNPDDAAYLKQPHAKQACALAINAACIRFWSARRAHKE